MRLSITPFLVVLAFSSAGCSGGDGDDGPAPATNAAPTISGSPISTTDEDEAYVFTPDASDADGDSLSFSIAARPAWATFDPDTGTLSGTPVRSDVGTYEDVTISVSDGTATASLTPFSLEVVQVDHLTIAGIASDAPLANAAITIYAGGREITATADADGSFSVPVRLRAGEFPGDSLMRIVAIGNGEQANVELVTLVGDLASLIDEAGADATLDGGDNGRTNVSHVSTALYLLAIDYNDGEVPADADALKEAEESVDTSLLLETAAIIKLIVDQGVIQIPDGETSLSILTGEPGGMTNRQTIEALLADNGLMDESGEPTTEFAEALAEAKAQTLADDSILPSFRPDELIGSTVWTLAAHPDRVPWTGDVLRFDEDGTGTSYYRIGSSEIATEPLTWAIEGSTLDITYHGLPVSEFPFFDDPQVLVGTYGFDQAVADFMQENMGELSSPQIQINRSRTGRTSRLISAGQGRLHLSSQLQIEYNMDEVLQDLGWQGPLPRGAATVGLDLLVYTGHALVNALELPPAAGESWAVPVVYQPIDFRVTADTDEGRYSDVFRLNQDSTTAMGLLSLKTFDWSATNDGLVFESGDERYVFTPFATDGQVYLALISHYVNDVLELQSAALIARLIDAPAGDLPTALPEYWQMGLNTYPATAYESDGRLKRDRVFGYVFNADGTSKRIFFGGDNCLVEDNVACFGASDFVWTANGDTITQEQAFAGGSLVRIWRVLSHDGEGRAAVLDYQLLGFGGDYEFSIYPRIDQTRLMDLSTWPEELADSGL